MSDAPPTLWHSIAPDDPGFAPLAEDATAEVAIVGGGIAGLSTALELAREGTDVALLEARRLGWGASGRNAGFVVPNFSKADPAMVRERLGRERGDALLRLVGSGADAVFDFARAHGLGTQAAQSGWLQPAHSHEAAAALRARVAAWQGLGRPVSWIEREETAARTGCSMYHGALHDASAGTIDPLAYVRALGAAVTAGTGRIHEGTEIADISPDGDGWLLTARGGARLRARCVLVCTNGDATGAARTLSRRIVPLSVYQIATGPIPRSEIERFSPRREPVSDTRANIFTFRLTPGDRLISGGMAILPLRAEGRMGRRIAARLARELSLSNVPEVDFVWRGTAAVTPDFLPHVYEFSPGLFAAIGCNGRGVAMTSVMGRALAPVLRGVCGAADLTIPLAPSAALPFRAFGAAAPSAFLVQGMLRDRGAIRSTRNARKAHHSQPTEEKTQ